MVQQRSTNQMPVDDSSTRTTDAVQIAPPLVRPQHPPQPESIDEVAKWAESEDLRRTELIYAPAFWVALPLAAIGFLIHQSITDPTGAGWAITSNGENSDSWPGWVPWLAWIGVSIWLIIAVGVLVFRLGIFRDLREENTWVFEHGVAHSLHRASLDYDDGEARWATHIALDHRIDDQQAASIYARFEEWLAQEGLPPADSRPLASATLFGAPWAGGYFLLHLALPGLAGATTEHMWVLITEPREGTAGVIITPVPVPKQLQRIRARLHRKGAHPPKVWETT